ncbi:MAG: alpha-amylase [Bacillota bacterium]|nr:alpha-amylase [Bacillota bacterium]
MGVMMQFFEYDIQYKEKLWVKLSHEAWNLSKIGITAVWLPPAFKGASGTKDVGYGIYDLYDLGEFDQKGARDTKYGSVEEYIWAIESCHRNFLQVYGDIVFNHKMGADGVNSVKANAVSSKDRKKISKRKKTILAPTQFNFEARNNQYSAFKWTADHFTGVDVDCKTWKREIYLLDGKEWSSNVSSEFGNYDFLFGANVDHNQKDVKEELNRFVDWYLQKTGVDGFRLDALKHIDYEFYKTWITYARKQKDLFMVGEYWSGVVEDLMEYLSNLEYSISLFDVPLHYRFVECSRNKKTYDLRNLFKDTLIERDARHAVTFVDNHDTQSGKSLASWVYQWFKPMAYACILLREQGYPCIFYGDYYGLHKGSAGIQKELELMLMARSQFSYGWQKDYFEDDYQMGWTREGGLAVLFSIRQEGEKWMYVGEKFNGRFFYDIFHPRKKERIENGYGHFTCKKEGLSVYILE